MSHKFKRFLIIISIIIGTVFIYINFPLFYERDTPEAFRFASDDESISKGIDYDICNLDAISSLTLEKVDFYFGCSSSKLKNYDENNSTLAFMIFGRCGKIINYEDINMFNGLPDYYITFPFEVENISRSCKTRMLSSGEQIPEEVKETPVLHSNHDKEVLIEWSEKPGIDDFRFFGKHVAKRISFDTYSINYYISTLWKDNSDYAYNPPKVFNIKLLIPKKYSLVNQDMIYFSDNIPSSEYLKQENWLIESNLMEKNLHILILDPSKYYIQVIVNWLFGLIVALWVGYVSNLFSKPFQTEPNKN